MFSDSTRKDACVALNVLLSDVLDIGCVKLSLMVSQVSIDQVVQGLPRPVII